MNSRADPPIAQLQRVTLAFGGEPLFAGVDLALTRGTKAALIGRNGVGKSTLMKILAGSIEPDSGEIWLSPGASAIFVSQETDLGGFETLRDYVIAGLPHHIAHEHHRADAALMEMDLDVDARITKLSGGEIRRAALARAFASDPDILLLDEPTNHLDIPAVEALEKKLLGFRGALLFVSHDRRFLENVSNQCVWLRRRKTYTAPNGYRHFDDWSAALEAEEEKNLSRLETQLRQEQHWLMRGVTARRTRNEGRLARLYAMRAQRRELLGLRDAGQANLVIDSGQSSGRLAVEAKNISKSFPMSAPALESGLAQGSSSDPAGRKIIVRDLSLRVLRGDRIGIVGPNGAGKSTLLDLLFERQKPDAGSVKLGTGLDIAFLDQTRDRLQGDTSLWDCLAPLGGDQILVRGTPRHVASYAQDFLFDAKQLRQPVSALSGGERNRLQLAIALARPTNLLVLDEPTNDLDMDTLELLEELLIQFDGTLLVVSHDRAFLDNVVSSILWPVGDGKWTETPGGYRDYEREQASWQKNSAKHNSRPAKSSSVPSDTQERAQGYAPLLPPKAKGKMSFKDKHRLGELDRLIPNWESEIATLEAQLADPAIYRGPPHNVTKISAQLDALRTQLQMGEEEWLSLSEKEQNLAG